MDDRKISIDAIAGYQRDGNLSRSSHDADEISGKDVGGDLERENNVGDKLR